MTNIGGLSPLTLLRGPGRWCLLFTLAFAHRPLVAQQGHALGEAEPIGQTLLQQYLPGFMFEIQFLTLRLWQWAGLLALVLIAWLLAWLVAAIAHAALRPLAARTDTRIDDEMLVVMRSPARLLIAVGLFTVGSALLELPLLAYSLLGRIEVALAVVAAAWMGLRTVDILNVSVLQHLEASGRRAVISVLPLAAQTAKAFVLAVALLVLLQNLGFNVTGVIAGLGVGGIAVALAAQKSIANLFGGVSLVADQPVRVGDYCKFGDGKTGTVEEIGLRSTRVRTLDRTLVTIPNADFSELQLENYASRDRIRLLTVIGLRYETSPDQLRYVLAEVRKLLIGHPQITEDPARIRFIGFGAYSLDLEILAYVKTREWNEFLQVREDIFLRIMDIVHAGGTGFAFPSQTLYLGRDSGLEAEATRRAEEEVRGWRERNELPFPDFPEDTIAGLRGSLQYPPPGSATPPKTTADDAQSPA